MRFSFEESEHYQNKGGGAGFFKLVNDKDIATVRLLYNNADDIEGFSCHRVEIGDKFRYVNCLRTYRDPIDDCPLCKSGNKAQAKLFIPLYNEDAQEVQVWERGSKFFAKVSGVCTRYGSKSPIVSQIFEVERSGKPKDTATDYNFYRTEDPADDKTLDDFDMPKILGGIIIDATADDMEYYLDNGEFPPADDDAPAPRRSRREREEEEEERPSRRSEGRRTPARSRRNEDEF
jgi:hypothetical protein